MAELIARKLGPWTFDDLQSLPESPWRYEIVDGGLVMSPSPGVRHEIVGGLLRARLNELLAPGHFTFGPIGIDLHPSYRIPDLVVFDSALMARDVPLLQVADVELVIEIVSPGSLTTDRITKPAQYAAAGIPAFWRVDTLGDVGITAYLLRPGDTVYTELGSWSDGEIMRLAEPFEIELPIAVLVP